MEFSLDSIKRLFENLKTIGFLERIFQWGSIKSQLIEANGELQRIISISQTLKAENSKLENSLSLEKSASKNFQDTAHRVSTEIEVLKNTLGNQTDRIESLQKETASLLERNTQFLKRGTELSSDLVGTRQKIEILEKDLREIKDENARLKKDEEFRKQEHSNQKS
jgi:chromosome segregation ATPase